MIAGKPIAANDVDDARDVIIDGETGNLVTPHQPREMADRILTLLNNDELCDQMGVNAKQHAKQYTSENMIKQIVSLCIELVKHYHGGNLSQA